MTNLPATVADLLRRQRSLVSRRQLARIPGLSLDRVDTWVRRGVLEQIHVGVYRLRGSASSPEQTAMAAVLRAREGARLTGPFVLGLLNIEGFTRGDPFEVLVPDRRRVGNVGFAVRRARIPEAETATVVGLPAVVPARAFVDTARHVAGKRLAVGFDSLRWTGLGDEARVQACAERLGRRDAGAAAVLDLLDEGIGEQESEGERALAQVLRGFDPQPEWGVWVTPRRRADALWRDVLLIIEYLGRRHHGHASQRRADVERDEELRAAGYDIAYVTAADLDDPASLRRRLVAHRERRGASLGRWGGAFTRQADGTTQST